MIPITKTYQIKDFLTINGKEIWIWSISFYSDNTIKAKTKDGEMLKIQ